MMIPPARAGSIKEASTRTCFYLILDVIHMKSPVLAHMLLILATTEDGKINQVAYSKVNNSKRSGQFKSRIPVPIRPSPSASPAGASSGFPFRILLVPFLVLDRFALLPEFRAFLPIPLYPSL
ncbi:uncharacterized protein [Drosophila kikkawai]|uniref:Uncharacterized protein n=1 Tax=Drosophila kikkawai TaxID=30033 RepID=A0ABM4GM05_DROKI